VTEGGAVMPLFPLEQVGCPNAVEVVGVGQAGRLAVVIRLDFMPCFFPNFVVAVCANIPEKTCR
jgi:hypothetical protein